MKLQPILNAREAALNIKSFMKDNHGTFIDVLKPLLPYIIGLNMLDAVISGLFFPAHSSGNFNLGALISSYFYVALAITWHRVAIHGSDQYIAMNPLKPQKHELGFIGMGIALIFFYVVVIGSVIMAAGMLGELTGLVIFFVVLFLMVYLPYKFSFYFPAKAINASITLKQSFAMTKGYFWKMVGAGFLASLKWILISMGYGIVMIVVLAIGFGMHSFLQEGEVSEIGVIGNLFIMVMYVPIFAYLQPLLAAFGVTVLSNYYQCALQNKPFPPAAPDPQDEISA